MLVHPVDAGKVVCAQFGDARAPSASCANLGVQFRCLSLRLLYSDFAGSALHEGICLDPDDYGL